MISARFHESPDAASWLEAALDRIAAAAARAILEHNRFRIVLAGGETPRAVYRGLRTSPADWPRWEVFFGDERCLPPLHPERNATAAATDLLDHVPISPRHLHVIPAELGAERGAALYAQTLRGIGDFDLVLLGLGEDGHTASLFPGHDWGESKDAPDALAVLDAPKPPPERISLSAERLSRAREVLFLVSGASKRRAIERWRAGERIPAAAIRPAAGADVLVVD